ncbi:ribosome hibernation factor-recruiting GTPase MRF [Aldersonia kunmingensis]|uniref:ribosome hibernation factor-recruiting GTPase MRF n=1 Tax=Aldersonia kunmingensis TaxID=408066 RepID=UPI001650F75F|nr:GTP-binding protein [Aldersonia kunmingensis]
MVAVDERTPLVLVAGWRGSIESVAQSLLDEETIVVHHSLDAVEAGLVPRTVTTIYEGRRIQHIGVLKLDHGCVSCALRKDLLPLLRQLHRRSNVSRIVVQLDPQLEPEALAWAIEHIVVSGMVGYIDGPAARDVRIEGVVTCIDSETWLDDATGDARLTDGRTVAQVAVGQVAFADALVVSGRSDDGWAQARLHATLARLAPGAPIQWGVSAGFFVDRLLSVISPISRRGAIGDVFEPLLRGEPPLHEDCGVALFEFTADRPFHPERLHDAVEVLLDGVLTARGRIWLATQNDQVLWLESAGGGLRVTSAGRWLAAMTADELDNAAPTRRAMAALTWDERFGDRHTSLVVLAHAADPAEIDRALRWALLTDDELGASEQWQAWPDPFGRAHTDPCGTSESPYAETDYRGEERE